MPFRADVVVVGAGIIGTAAALFLAKRGLSVVVCEKGHVACEQSSRNWGWVRKMGRDPAEIPLSIASARLWSEMNTLTGAETGFRQTGIYYLCKEEKDVQKYEQWLTFAKAHDLDSSMVDRSALKECFPTLKGRWEGALYTKTDGRAEPSLATNAIATALRASGGQIIENCAVRSIETAAGAVHSVVTEHGEIRCDTAVLATGAWTRLFCGNLGIDFPQLKVIGSVMRTNPLDGPPECSVAGQDFAFRKRLDGGYTIAQKNANIAQIVPDSFRLFFRFLPAFRSEGNEIRLRFGRHFFTEMGIPKKWRPDQVTPFEITRMLDPKPSAKILAEGLRNLTQAFPEFANATLKDSWGCAIDVTPDAVPVIDRVDEVQGLVIASGFSGHGFGIGPGAAYLIADLVTSEKPIVSPEPFKLARLRGKAMSGQ
ncbi:MULTISPECIES: NAD(P)/FAD-dependent oxidoreductase [unclassified Mesorhizobium]|uniref:NAD(P)/FAD-dependent oxidoreductase n=1 Tax=unclassified Mesorhizobium TaxID=325217 RepID=UPI001CCA8FC7|nr:MULTISPECIES: FAD-binding oxidoreductase [unclassified Mesorhizobium]MBZ9742220.1 FAD-binding oxidoreductase [Mesorhizobium sp. CO1-1-4]